MTDTTRTSTQTREFTFDLSARGAGDAIPVVVSSDSVVEVADGPEILVHTTAAIDLSRAPLPIIATHRGGQVNVGIVDSLAIVGGQLRGLARFGTRPEAAGYREDVLAGIIRSVSVGYARITARIRKDGVMVTERWLPSHAALVAEPADINAGFFRELGARPIQFQPDDDGPAAAAPLTPPPAAPAATPEGATMADQETTAGASADHGAHTRAALPPLPQGSTGNRALEMEQGRRRGIENLCRANKIDDNIRDHWIGTGLAIEAITDDLLQIIEQRGKNAPKSDAALGLSEGETRRFSLFNAVRATADKNWTKAGFELECSRAIAQKLGRVPDPNRFFVPFEVQHRSAPSRRDLTAATGSGGGFLVATQNLSFIEMLRNRSVAYRMGARSLSGLQGSVTVPRQTGAATAVWLANEASTATESQQTFAQMALTPKTVGAYTEISRNLMLQSSPDAEAIVQADLAQVAALAIDVGVLRGSGASGEPTGIINTAGIGSVTGTSLAYAGILEFQSDVATANVMPAMGGYATTPAVAALMMARQRFSSTDTPLWIGNLWDGQMSGFAAMSTNQMTAASMLFGDWSQVIVGEWGVLEVEVNPYANFQAGIIGIRAMVTIDVGLRYPAAFSLATSIT